MSSSHEENRFISQKTNITINKTKPIRLKRINLRNYFTRNENIQHKEYIDNIKIQGSVRLVSMNTHRCSSTNEKNE